jgi:hypothetical protein
MVNPQVTHIKVFLFDLHDGLTKVSGLTPVRPGLSAGKEQLGIVLAGRRCHPIA